MNRGELLKRISVGASRVPTALALLAGLLLSLAGIRTHAAEFCVSTPAEFLAALEASKTNGQDDRIMLVTGRFEGHFQCSYSELYGLSIEGGYAPGCLERENDPSRTVLDGSGAPGTTLGLSTSGYPIRGDLSVANLTISGGTIAGLYASGETVDITDCAIVDNRGTDPGVATAAVGGAFLKASTLLRVTDCLISGNRSYGALAYYDGDSGGGGIYIPESASVEIRGSTFTGNQTVAGYAGALLVNYGGTVLLEGNTFEGNQAEYVAGVYLSHCSNVTVRGNLFTDNWNPWTGGLETYFSLDGDIVLEGNVFRGNTGSGGGGARLVSPVRGGAMRILGNTFEANTASVLAGGLFLGGASLGGGYSTITVANNVFAGNTANQGGGLWINAVEPIILTNNTFVGNSAFQRAGGAHIEAGYSTCRIDVWNNIFRENAAPVAGEAEFDNEVILFGLPVHVPLELSHNEYDPAGILVAQPGYVPAPTNIGPLDPRFVDAAGGDYRLSGDSPCIDYGSAAAPGLPTTDADGYPRLSGAGVDLGAYEAATPGETVTAPGPPEGPAEVIQGIAGYFLVPGAVSSYGHLLEYEFDWGDGPSGIWAASGQEHSWVESGTFAPRARARCAVHTDIVSGWSPPLAAEAALFREDFSGVLANWELPSGGWRIDLGGRLRSSPGKRNQLLAVVGVPSFPSPGRLELDLAFGKRYAVRPNATIVFAWKDPENYRYLRLARGGAGWRAVLGQVGDPAGDGSASAVLARSPMKLSHPGESHRLRLDLDQAGGVRAYLDESADAFIAADFVSPAGGRVGLRAVRALVRFDDILIQDGAVLP